MKGTTQDAMQQQGAGRWGHLNTSAPSLHITRQIPRASSKYPIKREAMTQMSPPRTKRGDCKSHNPALDSLMGVLPQ